MWKDAKAPYPNFLGNCIKNLRDAEHNEQLVPADNWDQITT